MTDSGFIHAVSTLGEETESGTFDYPSQSLPYSFLFLSMFITVYFARFRMPGGDLFSFGKTSDQMPMI